MPSEGFHESPQDLTPQTRVGTHRLRPVLAKVHNSPVIDGAVLFSTRGGDFLVTVGGNFTVGYRWHTTEPFTGSASKPLPLRH
jgi:uncharacterized linocin/CFP29 family protein